LFLLTVPDSCILGTHLTRSHLSRPVVLRDLVSRFDLSIGLILFSRGCEREVDEGHGSGAKRHLGISDGKGTSGDGTRYLVRGVHLVPVLLHRHLRLRRPRRLPHAPQAQVRPLLLAHDPSDGILPPTDSRCRQLRVHRLRLQNLQLRNVHLPRHDLGSRSDGCARSLRLLQAARHSIRSHRSSSRYTKENYKTNHKRNT